METFTEAYIAAALWSSVDDQDRPLDSSDAQLSSEAKARLTAEAEAFEQTYGDYYRQHGWSDAQAGHDFWLTRNRHGAGFWDRGLDREAGNLLTDAAHAEGESYLYVGDDGLIYAE